jgi:hypothetical protein
LLASDWYKERLTVKQHRDIALWQRHVAALAAAGKSVAAAHSELIRVSSPEYLAELQGTIGADPFHGQ